MKGFRLPRKLKKKLSKGFYLYPKDNKGARLWGHPSQNQQDYDAFKCGLLENMMKKWLKH